MKRRSLLAALGPMLLLGADTVRQRLHRRSGHAFGTEVAITVAAADPALAQAALDGAFAELRAVERVTSLFGRDTEIARLNADGRLNDPSPALLQLLALASELRAATGGAFDVSVQPLWRAYADAAATGRTPDARSLDRALALVDGTGIEATDGAVRLAVRGMEITLNGLAQGYAADRVLARLRQLGVGQAFVDTGELGAWGRHPSGRSWAAALALPSGDTHVPLARGCLATSSGSELTFTPDGRHHHILSPRTGRSPQACRQVTVLAPSAALADGLSTALMLVEPDQHQAVLSRFGAEALVVTRDGGIQVTEGFPLVPQPATRTRG